MDAFYASVEQRDAPELRGKAIAVGGGGRRGVVAAASYEARKFGVRSAMPGFKAIEKCPHLIFVKPRFKVYQGVSKEIRSIFEEYTDLIEPLSLDEAYLDVTENKKGMELATEIAQAIRQNIFDRTQLTASAGVSFNKFLAKIASDINKPDGMKLIHPQEAIEFLEKLPIEKFYGVGKVTAKKMHRMGIYTGADLKKMSKIELGQRFGKVGVHYYRIVRAEDDRAVNPNRIRKSIGAERTFNEDLIEQADMQTKLRPIINTVFQSMEHRDNFGRTLTLKVKTADFTQITRSKSFTSEVKDLDLMTNIIFDLLDSCFEEIEKVRLLGVAASNLEKEQQFDNLQLKLHFPDEI